MPPKVPRATEWRPVEIDDLDKEAGKLDSQELRSVVYKTLPYFPDLLPDDQRYIIKRIENALSAASVRTERNRTRPMLSTMQKNIGDLLTAIEATHSMLGELDVISQYRVIVSAGDYKSTPPETVVERGRENWARFAQALRDAAGWTANALQVIPPGPDKKWGLFGLDGLIIELADIFENTYVPKEELRPPAIVNTPEGKAQWERFARRQAESELNRKITSSGNAGRFLAFATEVAQLGPALRGVSINQVRHSMRRTGVASPSTRRVRLTKANRFSANSRPQKRRDLPQ